MPTRSSAKASASSASYSKPRAKSSKPSKPCPPSPSPFEDEEEEAFASEDDEEEEDDDESTNDPAGKPDTDIDPYEVLNVERDATEDQIKKAYRKLALRWHPDKAIGADAAAAHTTFQRLTFAYSILSSSSRRSRYDATGSTSEHVLDAGEDDFNWSDFFRAQYQAVTTESVSTFLSSYKGGEEERNAVLDAYKKGKGNMDAVYESVMGSNVLEDDERFRGIIDEAIESKEVEALRKYTEETDKSKAKRRRAAEAEAREAEVEAEKLKGKKGKGGKEGKGGSAGKTAAAGGGENDLMALIQKRQQERSGTFLSGMEAKYKKIEEEERARKSAKKGGKKRKQENVEADEPPEEAFASMGERMQKGKRGKR